MSESQSAGPAHEHHPTGQSSACPLCMARDAFTRLAHEFGPPERVIHHFRQARLEVLRGIRELIDYRIEKLSRSENKGTRITVE